MNKLFDKNDKWYIRSKLNLKHYIVLMYWKHYNNEKFLRFKKIVNYHGLAGFAAYQTVNEEYKRK